MKTVDRIVAATVSLQGPETMLTVSDIKQVLYCPRIIHYRYVRPVDRHVTFKMEEGKSEHVRVERLERRRTLRRYRLDEGERLFNVALSSRRLGISGVLDMLVVSPAGRFPVEVKVTTRGPSIGHRYQLVAYAMLVEEAFCCSVRAGFLYLVPTEQVIEVPITDVERRFVRQLLTSIRRLISAGRLPEVRHRSERCRECEYLRYCGDVDRSCGRLWVGGWGPDVLPQRG